MLAQESKNCAPFTTMKQPMKTEKYVPTQTLRESIRWYRKKSVVRPDRSSDPATRTYRVRGIDPLWAPDEIASDEVSEPDHGSMEAKPSEDDIVDDSAVGSAGASSTAAPIPVSIQPNTPSPMQ